MGSEHADTAAGQNNGRADSVRADAGPDPDANAGEQEQVDARWIALFEDRYGSGAYRRVIELLRQPCVTFAAIAKGFDVTRERVRQWHLQILPDAPRGHERQRLCGLYQQKRRLLGDPLFRAFYLHARPHLDAGRIELIKASDGYRTRSVRIERRAIAIRDASRSATIREGSDVRAYALARYRGSADFVYYRLTASDYLLVPRTELPPGGTTFSDRPASRFYVYKNTFDALLANTGQADGARNSLGAASDSYAGPRPGTHPGTRPDLNEGAVAKG